MSGVFRRVGSLRPGRSVFDLSYEKKFTCDMGQLIPVMCDEMVPGDTFKVANQVVIRFQPLVAPIMHEINVYVHYFFRSVSYPLGRMGGFHNWRSRRRECGYFTALVARESSSGRCWDPMGLSWVPYWCYPHWCASD